MQPHILEKALHAWPQWGGLIRDARFKTNFEPALLEKESESKRWEQEVGWKKVIRLSFEALEQMDLPWYFGFYWLACFCADYERKDPVDFSRITLPPQNVSEVWTNLVSKELVKDRGVVMLYHKGGPGKKLYPPYPFILETGYPFGIKRGEKPSDSEAYGIFTVDKDGKKHKVDGLFEVDKDGNEIIDIRTIASIVAPVGHYTQVFFGQGRRVSPELRVEFPSFLATEDVVKLAFRQIQAYRDGVRHYMSHPVLKYIGQAKPKMDEDNVGVVREVKEDIAQYQNGSLTFEDLLLREWERELKREGAIAVKLTNRMSESQAQTAIYHRVRRRLQRRGLTPPQPRKGWRSRLKFVTV